MHVEKLLDDLFFAVAHLLKAGDEAVGLRVFAIIFEATVAFPGFLGGGGVGFLKVRDHGVDGRVEAVKIEAVDGDAW